MRSRQAEGADRETTVLFGHPFDLNGHAAGTSRNVAANLRAAAGYVGAGAAFSALNREPCGFSSRPWIAIVNKVSDKTEKNPRKGKAAPAVRPAYAPAAAAIVLSWVVGWFAYQSSQEQILETIYRGNLNLARTLASAAAAAAGPERPATIRAIENLWKDTERRFRGSYLSVLPADGKLMLHTAKPELVGAQRGGAVIETDWLDGPRTLRELAAAQRDWAGRFTNVAGQEQVAAFAYAPALDALVAIHIPAEHVDAEIHAAARPWAVGLAIITFLLLPARSLCSGWPIQRSAIGCGIPRINCFEPDFRWTRLMSPFSGFLPRAGLSTPTPRREGFWAGSKTSCSR